MVDPRLQTPQGRPFTKQQTTQVEYPGLEYDAREFHTSSLIR